MQGTDEIAEAPPETEVMSAPAAAPVAEEPTPPVEDWATSEDIASEPFKAITLPVLGKRVRVRYLDNEEIVRLGMLPSLERFMELAEKHAGKPLGQLPIEVRREYALEQATYMRELAHRAVMMPDADPEVDVPCASCKGTHVPSLWTRQQTGRLDRLDHEAIQRVAEMADALEEAVGPLSEAQAESASSPLATTGDETPPTSSD